LSNYTLFTEDQIETELKDLILWNRKENYIIREFVASNFVGAISIVNAIAILAESADHHPDILIYGWNKVQVRISTHSAGGLTQKDFHLAKKIDELSI
jgi:4a-hydroxytetrahydrobiopterin dehydratase